MPTVRIPTKRITDWASFHDVFSELMSFPPYYGRNMDAWIDCMGDISSDTVILHLEDVEDFRSRCREIYDALIACSAFVNYRSLESGRAVLALSFWK
jgi:RNAse (barnase) inhibitor barstar